MAEEIDDKGSKSRTKTILWSGGLDSTVLAYQWLKSGWDLRLLSFSSSMISGNAGHLPARRRIIKALRNRFPKRKIKHEETEFDIKNFEIGTGPSLPQAAIWTIFASYALNTDEDVMTGWIRGDCVWEYLPHVEKLFEANQAMLGKTGKLICGMQGYAKDQVIEEAEKYKILHMCWWCEDPIKEDDKYVQCGRCESCLTHGEATWRIKKTTVKKMRYEKAED